MKHNLNFTTLMQKHFYRQFISAMLCITVSCFMVVLVLNSEVWALMLYIPPAQFPVNKLYIPSSLSRSSSRKTVEPNPASMYYTLLPQLQQFYHYYGDAGLVIQSQMYVFIVQGVHWMICTYLYYFLCMYTQGCEVFPAQTTRV